MRGVDWLPETVFIHSHDPFLSIFATKTDAKPELEFGAMFAVHESIVTDESKDPEIIAPPFGSTIISPIESVSTEPPTFSHSHAFRSDVDESYL